LVAWFLGCVRANEKPVMERCCKALPKAKDDELTETDCACEGFCIDPLVLK